MVATIHTRRTGAAPRLPARVEARRDIVIQRGWLLSSISVSSGNYVDTVTDCDV